MDMSNTLDVNENTNLGSESYEEASEAKKKAAVPGLACSSEAKLVETLTALIDSAEAALETLAAAVDQLDATEDDTAAAFHVKDAVIPAMAELRAVCDEAETLTAADFWPFPTYGELLFGV